MIGFGRAGTADENQSRYPRFVNTVAADMALDEPGKLILLFMCMVHQDARLVSRIVIIQL